MVGVYPYANNTIYMNEAIVKAVTGMVTAMLIFSAMVGLALYVFRALSLYKIARRRGISNAWLAWVPVCGDWILGSVADQYQYVVKGRVKNRRLPLLLLSILQMCLNIVVTALGISTMTYVLRFVMTGAGYPDLGRLILLTLLSVAQAAGMIAYLVIRCFVLYDVYSSCTSRNNVLFLVLGLVFYFLEPVFFFVCRNKEEGMPPRRDVPAREEAETVVEAEVPAEE